MVKNECDSIILPEMYSDLKLAKHGSGVSGDVPSFPSHSREMQRQQRDRRSFWSELCLTLGLCSSREWLQQYEELRKVKEGKEQSTSTSSWPLASLPLLALPTLLYLVFLMTIYSLLVYLYYTQIFPTWIVTATLVLVQFMIFTPGHDASHGAVSTNHLINGIVGRISFGLLGPVDSFTLWRRLHLQHHRFTNDTKRDPDLYQHRGPSYLLPLRWWTAAYQYGVYFLSVADSDLYNLEEKMEAVLLLAINLAFCWVGYDLGFFELLWWCWILPSFFSNGLITLVFGYLPHMSTKSTPIEDRWQTTANIQTWSFLQPLLSLVMHYQNYHLSHHLHPQMPFYLYKAKWESHSPSLQKRGALLRLRF